METRWCSRCESNVDINLFKIDKNGKYRFCCNSCLKIYKKEYSKKNPAKTRGYSKSWASRNKDKYKESQARYRNEHRQELNEAAKIYRQNNKEIIQEKDKLRAKDPKRLEQHKKWLANKLATDPEYKAKYRATCNENVKRYYFRHKKSILSDLRIKYYLDIEKSRETVRNALKLWRSRHPEQVKEKNYHRKLIRRGAILEGFNEVNHINTLKRWQHNKCYYCNTLLIDDFSYEKEHIIAIALNGKHSANNLVLSCKFCNRSKGIKLLGKEWNSLSFKQDNTIFIGDDGIQQQFGIDTPIKILSTFFISGRNHKNNTNLVTQIKQEYPNYILLFDWEWYNKPTAIKNILDAKIGIANKIAARNTELVELSVNESRNFLDTYHLQGFGRGTIHLGLIYNNELVAVTSWLQNKNSMELNRLASKGIVMGGFSKMLKFMKTSLSTDIPIISFVDPRYATGQSYENLGFKYVGETALPVYYYVNGTGIYHRRLFMKNNLSSKLEKFDPVLTEKLNAEINGYYRVYGMKQKRYLLN